VRAVQHSFAGCVPQMAGGKQVPQLTVPPQPSSMFPQL
jgi:hypothetical protein